MDEDNLASRRTYAEDLLRRIPDKWDAGAAGKSIIDLVAEVRRLRQLLMEYGRHTEGCSAAHGDQYRCRCGWRDVAPEFV